MTAKAIEMSKLTPDWSYQVDAVRQCRSALGAGENVSVGLVIPTGGGKTRIALLIGLEELSSHPDGGSLIWVTHRKRLRTQARRTLASLMSTPGKDIPAEFPKLLSQRVEFVMLSQLEDRLKRGPSPLLLIVDEAHHAAAPSYRAIFDHSPLKKLLLTATPIRTDALPIGIDRIGYTTTYRELFTRGVLVEPSIVEGPLLTWESGESISMLARCLLRYAKSDFKKTLVVVPTIEKTLLLFDALHKQLELEESHILHSSDVVFAHSAQTSTGANLDDFLDSFMVKKNGILVATTGLLAEGFDDPSLNAVVVAYPTSSIIQLMQAGGRALRWAPGKTRAFIMQARESDLEYRLEQRWLYQDISDSLRPQILDQRYSSKRDLLEGATLVLEAHRVKQSSREAVLTQLADLAEGHGFALMFAGLPYDGKVSEFELEAAWDVVVNVGPEGEVFKSVFNDFCTIETQATDLKSYLQKWTPREAAQSSLWHRLTNMLISMQYAHKEIEHAEYHGAKNRPFNPRSGTTSWLRYICVEYIVPPSKLNNFIADCINRDEVAVQYSQTPASWRAAVRLEIPLGGYQAFLLDAEQFLEFQALSEELIDRLKASPREQRFTEVRAWRAALNPGKLAVPILEYLPYLLDATTRDSRYLELL